MPNFKKNGNLSQKIEFWKAYENYYFKDYYWRF